MVIDGEGVGGERDRGRGGCRSWVAHGSGSPAIEGMWVLGHWLKEFFGRKKNKERREKEYIHVCVCERERESVCVSDEIHVSLTFTFSLIEPRCRAKVCIWVRAEVCVMQRRKKR